MNGFSNNLFSSAKSISLGLRELPNLSLSRLRKVFSLMGKKEKIALAILAAAALLSLLVSLKDFYYSHTSPAPANGGSYSEGLLGQPTYINPLLDTMEPDLSLTNLVFSGLYKYDANGQLVADLAEGMPQISADQKQYTVSIRPGAKWQDGTPITADDIVFTIQTLQDPNFKSPLRPLWQSTTVTKLSDYSVKFTTENISGPFIQNLTLPILPKAVWQNVSAQNFLLSKYNLQAVGSGPYAIKEIKKLPSGKVEQITLDANDNYYLGHPKIDQIVFKFYDTEDDMLNAFHSREILGFGFVPLGSNLYLDKNQPGANIYAIPLPQYQVVFFNLNNSILNDQNVRTALLLATDREQIINDVFKGNALLPVSPFVFNDPSHPFKLANVTDLGKAKGMLDSDGWKADPKTGLRANSKGRALSMTISTNDTLVNANAAQDLANQWRLLGIQVNLSILPAQQLASSVIKPRNFDVLLFPQKFGADPDPFLFWHSSQVKDPGFNLTGFSDPTADQLIIDARSTTNRQKRAADYQQFNQLIISKTPVIFLDQTEYIYAVDNSVKNISINSLYDPSQRFEGISNWYMEEKRVWK